MSDGFYGINEFPVFEMNEGRQEQIMAHLNEDDFYWCDMMEDKTRSEVAEHYLNEIEKLTSMTKNEEIDVARGKTYTESGQYYLRNIAPVFDDGGGTNLFNDCLDAFKQDVGCHEEIIELCKRFAIEDYKERWIRRTIEQDIRRDLELMGAKVEEEEIQEQIDRMVKIHKKQTKKFYAPTSKGVTA